MVRVKIWTEGCSKNTLLQVAGVSCKENSVFFIVILVCLEHVNEPFMSPEKTCHVKLYRKKTNRFRRCGMI